MNKNNLTKARGEYPADEEEKEILNAIERGEYKPLEGKEREEEMSKLKQAAENTLGKLRSVTIRLPEQDILLMKSIAADKGLPYQTYIRSLIHQHAKAESKKDGDKKTEIP